MKKNALGFVAAIGTNGTFDNFCSSFEVDGTNSVTLADFPNSLIVSNLAVAVPTNALNTPFDLHGMEFIVGAGVCG